MKLISMIVFLFSTSVFAQGWRCEARSITGGWGIGYSFYRSTAEFLAVQNCRTNSTPWDTSCYVTSCDQVN